MVFIIFQRLLNEHRYHECDEYHWDKWERLFHIDGDEPCVSHIIDLCLCESMHEVIGCKDHARSCFFYVDVSFESFDCIEEPLVSSVVEDAEHCPGEADSTHDEKEMLEAGEVVVEPAECSKDHSVSDSESSEAEDSDPHEENKSE